MGRTGAAPARAPLPHLPRCSNGRSAAGGATGHRRVCSSCCAPATSQPGCELVSSAETEQQLGRVGNYVLRGGREGIPSTWASPGIRSSTSWAKNGNDQFLGPTADVTEQACERPITGRGGGGTGAATRMCHLPGGTWWRERLLSLRSTGSLGGGGGLSPGEGMATAAPQSGRADVSQDICVEALTPSTLVVPIFEDGTLKR